MKKVLTLSLAILMVASYAMADDLGVFTDQAGTTCEFSTTAIGPVAFYVVHRGGTATGSQFKVVNNSSWSLTAQVLVPLSIGEAFSDLALSYGPCSNLPLAVLQLNGFSFPVPHPPCGVVEILAANSQPNIISVDCNFAENPANGGKLVIEADTSCPCVEPNATEESTWGKVKSLYR